MASESGGQEKNRDQGHRNHFRLLGEEGLSWSGREPNTLFQNRGPGADGRVRFDEVGNVLGVYLRLDSRGVASADLDGDGDLDLVVYNRNNPTIKIYRNDTPGQGNLALVDLRGTTSEPLAAGAQAVLSCDGRDQLRQVELGSGFLAQSAPTLHFGLGGCRRIDSIEVRWPSGETGRWTDLPVDHRLVLTEGSTAVDVVPLRPRNYNRNELAPAAGELSAPRPELRFARVDGGGELALADLDGGTAVLNFWATWCTACLAEMPDLEALHRQFGLRGVRFVGIALDEGRPSQAVREFLAARGVTYEQVWGDVEQQQPFASLGGSPPGAVPITAVIHRGTVRDVRVGKIDRQELSELLERLLG
ncbi:MAG: ASPIC/UnbV domain-containing protein [Thermoanaerobaculia bacterium]